MTEQIIYSAAWIDRVFRPGAFLRREETVGGAIPILDF
jgi:hypothetical protein